MCNYVGIEKFMEWYRRTAKAPLSQAEVLSRLYSDYCQTRKGEFELGPGETVSGKAESYPFSFENIGCCGASTVYIYF